MLGAIPALADARPGAEALVTEGLKREKADLVTGRGTRVVVWPRCLELRQEQKTPYLGGVRIPQIGEYSPVQNEFVRITSELNTVAEHASTPLLLPAAPILALRTRRYACAMPLAHIVEVMRPLPVEPLAGAPAGVAGLAIIRGRATPVVDLAALLDDGATASGGSARFVTLRIGARSIALLVEAVLSVRALARVQFEELPPLWQGAHPPAVAALGALDRELFLVLEAARLLPGHDTGGEPS